MFNFILFLKAKKHYLILLIILIISYTYNFIKVNSYIFIWKTSYYNL
jgi:hypothetical protein